ncbi:MAG: undecaprenyldiphospho-muramoylpentapeptide beta-N-acetylglucosaminyltransferase [Candidatus Portnoybacteria bacterium CG11_big_fil_rev_8_21_14_0_20_40_15]|uniref:UDP-N-acetylglucosamine--N-acetylmuramyl-(pentapeptide) pyrophosphoryl-undecaprenol N-acetylglucosamine transferase n=2 Tax=Candidatus Portnoyibacteriota TaxID=1817913 RepID=A0A2H0KVT1_9BACT|nr:MAG: undecaprenyldiphospho-muramoylpentapeptide beta-N-acetylglucosaminyltransferase [Candidatus Portnoybacteria bacterium CG11_big_fil_rev_8_21_14_0_20_40_15]PJA64417.1 MAG: undecaprenyldiphospho-muramoylpentapeptide beta-N-acetylglucosaminyltransferase [Candidatus Portnoybacteria bacterium CG_4_9_14_3_um_filter_40_10]
MRIIFTGGGTGGHLFPIIAVARELKKINQTPDGQPLEMLFVGPKTVGEEAFSKEGIASKNILAGKLRRYFSGHNLLDVFRVIIGFFESLWILFSYMPNVVFSKGGFGSVPVILVAWIYRIPVLVHESDSVPGLSVKLTSHFSKRIAISFPRAASFFPAKKTALLGNPVRSDIFSGSKEQAKSLFQLAGQKPLLLILGGSQGAKTINDIVFLAMKGLLEKCEIIHQCGQENFSELKTLLGTNIPPEYHLYSFLDEEQMKHALAAADLVISRAGAGSIFEIAGSGKPSILIPLPDSAGDHQKTNAFDYALTGATLVLVQENLTPNFLKDRVFALLENPDLLAKMSAAAKTFAKPDADRIIAQEVLSIAKH